MTCIDLFRYRDRNQSNQASFSYQSTPVLRHSVSSRSLFVLPPTTSIHPSTLRRAVDRYYLQVFLIFRQLDHPSPAHVIRLTPTSRSLCVSANSTSQKLRYRANSSPPRSSFANARPDGGSR